MANLALGVLGHHYTQQAALYAGKRVGGYVVNQGVKYVKRKVKAYTEPVLENLKRRADDFQQIDTVPLKRRNVPCPTQAECFHDGYLDGNIYQNNVASNFWNGAELGFFYPIQGDDITDRTFRRLQVKRLTIRLEFRISNQNWDQNPVFRSNPVVRFIIYVDKQTNGTASNASMVIDSTGFEAVQMFQNLLFLDRFTILHDDSFPMNPVMFDFAGVVKSGQYTTSKYVDIPLDMIMHFNANNTGLIDSIVDNSLYCAVCVGPDNSSRLAYDVRLNGSYRVTFQNI